tara:strand:- start:418 stop:573 length:156 start_codon:yes stop_codon:yes gene_type:complete
MQTGNEEIIITNAIQYRVIEVILRGHPQHRQLSRPVSTTYVRVCFAESMVT